MAKVLEYHRTAKRPDLKFWLTDDDGNLVDLSTGYTFEFKLGSPGSTAVFTKTSGITGASGTGVEPTGTPNLTVSFSGTEMDSLSPGTYGWQVKATLSSLPRYWTGMFTLRDVIT